MEIKSIYILETKSIYIWLLVHYKFFTIFKWRLLFKGCVYLTNQLRNKLARTESYDTSLIMFNLYNLNGPCFCTISYQNQDYSFFVKNVQEGFCSNTAVIFA
jgi:hypothetical protein